MSPSIYKEFTFDSFIGGYNSDVDPEVLPKHFLSAGNNVQYNKGIVSKRDGRQLFSSGPFTGTVYGLWVFQKSDGTSTLMALTTSNLYKYNPGSQTWTDITPIGGLNGTTTLAPQFLTYNDKVYITNLVNSIILWDGITANASFVTGNGAPDSCWSIMVFAGFFFAIRPTISASTFGWRVMWSDFNNPTIFNTGQAGAVDLNDTAEQVMTADTIGRWMSIYKNGSTIYNTVFVGSPVFFDFRRIDTPAIAARRTLAKIPMLGLCALGKDDFYIFDQNQSRPIGKPVRQETLTNVNWSAIDTANAWVRPDIGRVYVNLPFGTATLPNKVWSYSYIDGQWMPEGDYQALAGLWAEFSSNLLVSQLTNPISSYNLTIDQLARLNQRLPLTTDGTNIYFHAAVSNDFNARAINSTVTTAETPLQVKEGGEPVPSVVYEIRLTSNNVPGTVAVTLKSSIGDGIYQNWGPYSVTFNTSMVQRVNVEAYGERFSVTVANQTVNEAFQLKSITLRHRTRDGRV